MDHGTGSLVLGCLLGALPSWCNPHPPPPAPTCGAITKCPENESGFLVTFSSAASTPGTWEFIVDAGDVKTCTLIMPPPPLPQSEYGDEACYVELRRAPGLGGAVQALVMKGHPTHVTIDVLHDGTSAGHLSLDPSYREISQGACADPCYVADGVTLPLGGS
jgi:hypothetical protein